MSKYDSIKTAAELVAEVQAHGLSLAQEDICRAQDIFGRSAVQDIDLEIRQQAIRLYPKCAALFELPLMVYSQIMQDNDLRQKPYRVSETRIKKIISSMPEFQ